MKYLQDYINELDLMYDEGNVSFETFQECRALLMEMSAGLPPDQLRKDQVLLLEQVFGNYDWFQQFGYECKEYKRSKHDAKYRRASRTEAPPPPKVVVIPPSTTPTGVAVPNGTVRTGVSWAKIVKE